MSANLMYGKIRGVIAKSEGKRHFSVKTKTAVMGVRGTDFFVYDDGENGTEVSVLRGEVEVTSQAGGKAASAKAGYIAYVAPGTSGQTGKVALRKLAQQDLGVIKSASHIAGESGGGELKRLEEKSVEAVRKDIEAYNPKVASETVVRDATSSGELNTWVVDQYLKTATKATGESRLHRGEAEDVEGAYGKYFGK